MLPKISIKMTWGEIASNLARNTADEVAAHIPQKMKTEAERAWWTLRVSIPIGPTL